MWKVIYIAPTEEIANKLKAVLAENGFLCQTKSVGTKHKGGLGTYEISVPVSEAEDAYEVLCESKFQG